MRLTHIYAQSRHVVRFAFDSKKSYMVNYSYSLNASMVTNILPLIINQSLKRVVKP